MRNTDRENERLPDEFASEDQAGEFWDTHSLTDYEQFLEPVAIETDLKRRHFEIEVDEESFVVLLESAKKQHKPVKQLASEILKQKLISV